MTLSADAAALIRTGSGLRLHTVDEDGSERIIDVKMNTYNSMKEPELFIDDGTIIFSKDHESKNYLYHATQQ